MHDSFYVLHAENCYQSGYYPPALTNRQQQYKSRAGVAVTQTNATAVAARKNWLCLKSGETRKLFYPEKPVK